MGFLPFVVNHVSIMIKRYPRRIVYELPHYEGIHKIKVVKHDDRWFAIATLEGEVSRALGEDKDTVVDIGNVESPVARDSSASSSSTRNRT